MFELRPLLQKPENLGGSMEASKLNDIKGELETVLLKDLPSCILLAMARENLLRSLLPELVNCIGFDQHSPRHHLDVFEHTLAVVDGTPPDLLVRWAALLHDIGKPFCFSQDEDGVGHFYGHDRKSADMAVDILGRLGYPEEFVRRVCSLVYYHMTRIFFHTERPVRKVTQKLGEDDAERLMILFNADLRAHAPENSIEEPVLFEVIYRRLQVNEL